jgi:hypothetical protein
MASADDRSRQKLLTRNRLRLFKEDAAKVMLEIEEEAMAATN